MSAIKQGLHIITGASRGLGSEIAMILAEKGHRVVILNRRTGPVHPLIQHIEIDLSHAFDAIEIFDSILGGLTLDDFSQLTLVNNAGMINPISPAGRFSTSEAQENIFLNLTAPVLLTTEFLRRTNGFDGQRLIFNVTSGVGRKPKASWSVYSAAKGGLDAFSLAVKEELSSDQRSRIFAFDPGIMDTEMQAKIRNVAEHDFPERGRFINFKDRGELLEPRVVANLVCQVILDEIRPKGVYFSVRELIS